MKSSTVSAPAPRRRWRWRLGFLVVAGLALEGILRWYHVCDDLPKDFMRLARVEGLGSELEPGADVRWGRACIPVPVQRVHVSSQGLRDREFATPKPPGTFRITVIGDSAAFGWGVAEDEAYAKQLEKRFHDEGRTDVEVLNFGVPGYNLEQYVLALENHALPFQPDLVIVGIISNDIEAKMLPPRTVLMRPVEWSHLFRAGYFAGIFVQQVGAHIFGVKLTFPEMLDVEFPRLRALAEQHGFRVLLVGTDRGDEQGDLYQSKAKQYGLPWIDVGPALAARPRAEMGFPLDLHPTPVAHRLIADQIHEALLRFELIPPPAPAPASDPPDRS